MYCNNRYDVSEIKDWIEDNHGLTAQCPYCWVDCIIPEIIDGKIVTDEELKEMEKYYFEQSKNNEILDTFLDTKMTNFLKFC